MCKTNPNPQRAELGFPEAVLQSFGFLEERGFHCTRKDSTFVRYESPRVFVNVYHGRASYELNVEVGLLATSRAEEERPFSLAEILELSGGLPKPGSTPPQAGNAAAVKNFVPQLAAAVERHAAPALAGDGSFFAKLSGLRLRHSETYLKDLKLKHVREKANEAWHEKDYLSFLKLYEPVQADLSPAELKKLAYARKHL